MKISFSFVLLLLFLTGCNLDGERTLTLLDSLDRAHTILYIKNDKVIKGDLLDTLGNKCGIIHFNNDSIIYEEEWDYEGNSFRKYSNGTLKIGLKVGSSYIESNYSSVIEFKQVRINDQIQYYRPLKFDYDSSEFFDVATEQLRFKTVELNENEPTRSKLIRYENGIVQSEDTVTGNFLVKFRNKLTINDI